MRRQVVEQGKVLADVYRTGGKPALDDAIEDTIDLWRSADRGRPARPARARRSIGNLAAVPVGIRRPARRLSQRALIRLRGQTTPREAAIVAAPPAATASG